MAMKICTHPQCKKLIPKEGPARCDKHHHPHHRKCSVSYAENNHRKIYNTRRWRKLASDHKAAFPICIECQKLGLATPVKVTDHIKEISDGGDPWDWDNLQSLCHRHHQQKTQQQKRKRAARSTLFDPPQDDADLTWML